MMKKSLLALAVAALSANAFAASLNYTAPASVIVNTIAKEVVTVTSATDLTTIDTITWPLGFSITDQNLVRIDLSNGAKFTVAPKLTVNGSNASIAQGGLGESFVVFQFATGATAAFSDSAVLTLAGLTVANQGSIDARYRLYSSQPDAAAANTNTLVDKTYAYAKFANALVFAANNSGASKQIDVTKESKQFENGAQSLGFGGLNLSVTANTYGKDLTTGKELTLAGVIDDTTATLTISGDFSAIDTTVNPYVTLDTTPGIVNSAKTSVTVPLTGITKLDSAKLAYTVTGNTVIAPSSYNAKLNLGTGALLASAPADVSNFATLAKNGATDHVDLQLKPNGAYQDFVRITNKTGIAGNVYLTVYADDGKSATITLGDIAGQTTSLLGAQASTSQINIVDIYNAAAAKGLVLTGDQKLRLVVDGEFKDDGNTGLSVQSYTVSKDNNSFATF